MSVSAIMLEVRPWGFVPAFPWDAELREQFPLDSVVRATLSKEKSWRMFRYYWQLMSLVGKATDIGKTPLSNELLFRTGFVDKIKLHASNELVAVPMSIGDMDHATLSEYVSAALILICTDYIAEMPRGELLKEVERMTGISYAKAFGPKPRSR